MSLNVAKTTHDESGEKPKVKYQLMVNAAAGEYKVNEWTEEELEDWENSGYRTQEGHYTEVGLFDTQEELDVAIEEEKGEPVFAVFENGPAGEVHWSQEDNLSGNWRGSREGHANLVDEFKTQAEAEKDVAKRREYFDSLLEEKSA